MAALLRTATPSDLASYAKGRIESLRFLEGGRETWLGPLLVVTATHPSDRRFLVILDFDVSGRTADLIGVGVQSVPGSGARPSGNTLQRLAVRELLAQLDRLFNDFRPIPSRRSEAWALTAAFRDNVHPGRAGREDIHYARVAAKYVAALGSHAPVSRLADELGITEQAVRDLLRQARRRGLLTKAEHGRASGRLTAKARKLLDGEH